jgi:hypothetical protein
MHLIRKSLLCLSAFMYWLWDPHLSVNGYARLSIWIGVDATSSNKV